MNQGQPNQTDQTANFFWMICLVAGAVLLTWFFVRQVIVTPIFWMRVHEIDLINAFSDVWIGLTSWLHLPLPHISILDHVREYMITEPASKVPFKDFAEINDYVGDWMRYPIAAIMLGAAAVVYFQHTSTKFRQVYTMNSLKKLEQQNWPQITPVLSLDLIKEDLEKGPWAMATTPIDFAKNNHLVTVLTLEGKEKYAVNKGAAERLFAMQLGPLWKGLHRQAIHVKALFVIFMACAKKDRATANKFLAQIAASAAHGQLDFSGVEAQLKQYHGSKLLQWLEQHHAYTRTLLATLLEMARTDGVLATAEFLWLKPLDRKLWYTLNSVGRQTAVVEASGIFAHWLSEKKLGRGMKVPLVKEAVVGLELSIEATLFVSEGEKWQSYVD